MKTVQVVHEAGIPPTWDALRTAAGQIAPGDGREPALTHVRTGRPFRPWPAALALAAAVVWPAPAPAQVAYTIQDLGPGQGRAINASGQVAGIYFNTASAQAHAFRTTAAGTIADPGADLGALPGLNYSSGQAINSAGQVTGISDNNPLPGSTHAFRTTATGNLSDPGADLGFFQAAMGINDTGRVIVFLQFALRTYRSSPNGEPVSFSDLGRGQGTAINASGQVTGYTAAAAGSRHAFRTTATGLISDPGTDLGTLPGSFESLGYAINDAGQVTGSSGGRAFRTTATGLVSDPGTDLGPGEGRGINALGVVVGASGDGSGGRAFVYDTQMRDLNALLVNGSGWVLGSAAGINDAGQIAGTGTIGGQTHAFRLTPVPIPEPSALVLVGCALAAWVARPTARRGSGGNSLDPGAIPAPARLTAEAKSHPGRSEPTATSAGMSNATETGVVNPVVGQSAKLTAVEESV